ncbi:Bromodomain protein [Oesophagostomum dentatum]|uniref:Bromodomain protein n=1 Tax=Oesophagostomum dentatum TaxID=61180 RepID=A0A0B1T1I8_OESDE|nr:Bromodomain protein [Oesophagostomum dentatum]
MKMENKPKKDHHPEDEEERSEADKDEEGVDDFDRDDSDSGEIVERWRAYVESADTPAQLALALQLLESSVAWELVHTLRLCQICRIKCEDPSATLRCTACRFSYHQECCKSPPSREWFCPACVESSTQVPTCLICSRQLDDLVTCRKCYHFFHAECATDSSFDCCGDFLCKGCDPRLFERRVIAHGECDDYIEADDPSDPAEHHHHIPNGHHPPQNRDIRKPLKRKAEAPPPVVFPIEMNADLCRAMLDELECQPGVGPFLEPVDLDLVPGYREAIANPIDMASIRNRVDAQCYETPDDFAADMELMFSNCRTFNEDDSPVGIAGRSHTPKILS